MPSAKTPVSAKPKAVTLALPLNRSRLALANNAISEAPNAEDISHSSLAGDGEVTSRHKEKISIYMLATGEKPPTALSF